MSTVITGTGSFIPTFIKQNQGFSDSNFYDERNELLKQCNADIIKKFQQITGIAERRYADKNIHASDMGVLAAQQAIDDAGVDIETIDQLIVAHNFADVVAGSSQSTTVPSLAAKIKNKLGIQNPYCVAYDILFGCPGWLQGLIQADAFSKSGLAKKCLVIGTETLSRVLDVHDRDSMIYSDGAGAVVTEMKDDADCRSGFLESVSASYSGDEVNLIHMGKSNNALTENNANYLKMYGRKVYEFALTQVPLAIKACLDKSNVHLKDVKKIFIHQANEKMDEAIIKRLFSLYEISDIPADIMPMNIYTLGNSSVATIPTLFDMVSRNTLQGHSINTDDIIVFASVGAGMNINAVCYRV